MDSITATVLLQAMDGLEMRAKVTAQNIANASTPNYRPLQVSFEDTLRQASLGTREDISNVSPKVGVAIDEFGRSELRLDLELATATSTAGRYGTLAELLNRRLQLEALAVSGSR
jgi:flagellar basal-body rod protein FlgB